MVTPRDQQQQQTPLHRCLPKHITAAPFTQNSLCRRSEASLHIPHNIRPAPPPSIIHLPSQGRDHSNHKTSNNKLHLIAAQPHISLQQPHHPSIISQQPSQGCYHSNAIHETSNNKNQRIAPPPHTSSLQSQKTLQI
jgi:hypothetical protein